MVSKLTSHDLAGAHERSLRGTDISRIIGLSDGVFAFALTLLVLQLTVPQALCSTVPQDSADCARNVLHSLAGDYTTFVLYVFTFGMIGLWWTAHHRVFRFIGKYDNPLIWLNLTFLLTIAVMPFVLGVFSAYPQTSTAVMLFAGTSAASGLLMFGIWDHAARAKLLSEEADEAIVKYIRLRYIVMPSVFLASLPVALVSATGAEVIWVGGFAALAVLRRRAKAGMDTLD